MVRKNKPVSKEETSLARPMTDSPLTWFDEMDRWFDEFRRGVEERFWGPLARWGESGLRVRQPLVDLIDEGSEFVVRAEIPGVAKEDIDLNLTPHGIEIRAKTERSREEKDKEYYFQERSYQALGRFLSFPEEVKAELEAATLEDGVLEVRVPKKEPTQPSKPVKVRVD